MRGTDTEVVHTTVFADGPGGGNPCPVVLDASGMSAEQMQAVARRFGQESGFVVSRPDEPVPRLRYFVPEHEMSMCVHATAAAVALLVQRGRLSGGHATVEPPVGAIEVDWDEPEPGTLPQRVGVAQFDPQFADRGPRSADVARALGIPESSIGHGIGPVQSVSVSRPKLIVPLSDVAALDRLAPPGEELWQLCEAHGTTGVYAVSAGEEQNTWFARQFPVRAGYPEDAATGVAAGALAGYLLAHVYRDEAAGVRLQVHQGRAMGRPSTLTVSGRRDGRRITGIRVCGGVRVEGAEMVPSDALPRSA